VVTNQRKEVDVKVRYKIQYFEYYECVVDAQGEEEAVKKFRSGSFTGERELPKEPLVWDINEIGGGD